MLTATRNPNLDLESVFAGEEPSDATDWLTGERSGRWWTGKPPLPGVCPGVGADGRITSLAQPNLATCTREQVQAYFDNGWTLNELLLSALQGEAAFKRPPYHHLRHPMAFYYGHTVVFFVNKLRVAGLIAESIDPYFERLFEVGVDEMSWDDMSKNEMVWPRVEEVTAYRRRAYAAISGVIATHPGLADGHAPIGWESPLWALVMGCEHERIHLETSSVLMRELPLGYLRRPEAWPELHPSGLAEAPPTPEGLALPANDWVEGAGGEVRLGKPHDWPSYGWDNEYGTRTAQVRPFRCSRFMISNAEFWGFVQAGGYHDRELWTAEGWRWREFRNAKWPAFWVSSGPGGLNHFRLRTLFEVIPMPWTWPAVVNRHEAQAWLAWRGRQTARVYRLPTEAEHLWLRDRPGAAVREPAEDPVMLRDGRGMAAIGTNLNLAFASESPVDAAPPSTKGVHDLCGNLWDWCEDDFHPLEGFRVHPLYDDFSTPCFDGEHPMILGGSFISTGDEASVWARFHFRPHFFQHAGFHAVDADGADGGAVLLHRGADGAGGARGGKYDTTASLDQYLMLHYGPSADAVPAGLAPEVYGDFPGRCARLLLEWAGRLGVGEGRALDIGCAVGASTFQLARRFQAVIGVDLSEPFIQTARTLAEQGRFGYHRRDEGERTTPRLAEVAGDIDRGRVEFRRADASSLPAEYADFDALLMANLIDRLPSPRALLGRLGGPRGLVRPGGLLLVTSPYTWREEFTPKGAWLGGQEGAESGFEGLRKELGDEFELIHRQDLPLVLREHPRKFELVIADASLWRRRGQP